MSNAKPHIRKIYVYGMIPGGSQHRTVEEGLFARRRNAVRRLRGDREFNKQHNKYADERLRYASEFPENRDGHR